MAIPFLNNIDLNDNEIQNVKLHNTDIAPYSGSGQIYFNTSDSLAKYYSNAIDQWVSLKDYSFSSGFFVDLSISGTSIKPIITSDLSATGTADNTTYLRGDNTWSLVSGISGTTYDLSGATAGIGDFSITLDGSDATSDIVTFRDSNTISLISVLANEVTITAKTSVVADGAVTLTTGNDVYDFVIAQRYVTTITDSSIITHSLNTRDVIVQLYDTVTYETVIADVIRTSIDQVNVIFTTTPTNSVRVLIQKIG